MLPANGGLGSGEPFGSLGLGLPPEEPDDELDDEELDDEELEELDDDELVELVLVLDDVPAPESSMRIS